MFRFRLRRRQPTVTEQIQEWVSVPPNPLTVVARPLLVCMHMQSADGVSEGDACHLPVATIRLSLMPLQCELRCLPFLSPHCC